MISLHITLGLCHLMFVIKTGSSCGGNSALEVVEMCSGGSSTARHFYLHGSPAGDVQRCDCNLTITNASGSVNIKPVPLTDKTATRGGTLTLPDGVTEDCTRTSRVVKFIYPGTTTLAFAYNTTDVRCCVEVELQPSEGNIAITCPNSTTTQTQSSPTTTTTASERTPSASASTSISSPTTTTMVQSPQPSTTITSISSPTTTTTVPITTTTTKTTTRTSLHTDEIVFSSTLTPSATTHLSTSTSTNAPRSTLTSTMTPSFENRSTSYATQTQSATDNSKRDSTTVASQAVSSFPVAAVAGGVGAGLLILLVVVVVVLCHCRGRHVDKQEELKGPTSVITVTNSLYESSAAINYTHPTKPLAIAEQQDNTPVVEDQISLGLTSDDQGGTPGIADHHDGTPRIAKQHDETPAIDEHRDGTTDMYALVNKPKPSSEATTTTEQPVHTAPKKPLPYVDSDLSKATKTISPPPIGENDIYAKVDKSSLKNKL
ncbi:flocculation protein FLO11-like isoform X2 [Haliotis rufescens]|nr:flocculation protein FLO11-like isoform X2 [Haliotis rufescens]